MRGFEEHELGVVSGLEYIKDCKKSCSRAGEFRIGELDALDQAWEIFDGKDNGTIIVDKNDEFVEKFVSKVDKLHEVPATVGWQPLKLHLTRTGNPFLCGLGTIVS